MTYVIIAENLFISPYQKGNFFIYPRIIYLRSESIFVNCQVTLVLLHLRRVTLCNVPINAFSLRKWNAKTGILNWSKR